MSYWLRLVLQMLLALCVGSLFSGLLRPRRLLVICGARSRNSKARILRTRLHRSLFRLPTPPPVALIFGDLYVVLCVEMHQVYALLFPFKVVIGYDTYLAFYRFRVNQNPNRFALASAGTISLSSSIRRFPIRLEQFWDMAAAQSLFNGERAVVVLFVSRIMLCADSSILYELLALVMLALPGASCGVLLGAITLPAVLASKLIQQSRGYLLREIELEEFEYFKLQYWATFSCCFSVLSFVAFDSKDSSTSQKSLKQNCWDVKLRFICLVFFTGLGSLSLVTTHGWGLPASVKLVYVVCQGLAAVKVVQHIIYTFPSCASIGEALLVTSGLVHCVGDMVACTVAEICRRLISPGLVSAQFGINRSEISTIIQEPYLGYLSFQTCLRLSSKYGDICQFVQELCLHPILWIVRFVFSEPLKRLSLCFYWVSLICVAVLRFYSISKHSKVERILLRKYYHLMAVCMFLPAVIYQPMFLDLAFGAALAVFLVLEIIRIWRMWPLGQLVHQFMTAFTDHRDSDILIVSHFSLLLGCALPIWMSSGYNDRPLAPFAGILSLGIGDTMGYSSLPGTHSSRISRFYHKCSELEVKILQMSILSVTNDEGYLDSDQSEELTDFSDLEFTEDMDDLFWLGEAENAEARKNVNEALNRMETDVLSYEGVGKQNYIDDEDINVDSDELETATDTTSDEDGPTEPQNLYFNERTGFGSTMEFNQVSDPKKAIIAAKATRRASKNRLKKKEMVSAGVDIQTVQQNMDKNVDGKIFKAKTKQKIRENTPITMRESQK
ncbi:unnamed protein product [Rhodiola kirilowii]